eukprot:m.109666 g.109666  ORF g.109666 m.109666 type:complete len:351 (-) comp27973_c0_seq1:76-1128(-)
MHANMNMKTGMLGVLCVGMFMLYTMQQPSPEKARALAFQQLHAQASGSKTETTFDSKGDIVWTPTCNSHWEKMVAVRNTATADISKSEQIIVDQGKDTHARETYNEYKKNQSKDKNAIVPLSVKQAHDSWEPEWVCESEIRLGWMNSQPKVVGLGDGPKFVCGMEVIANRPRCLIYSIGCNWKFEFEYAVNKLAPRCDIHTFDGTMDLDRRPLPTGLVERNIHFHDSNLMADDSDPSVGKTITSTIRDLGHVGRHIDILKIDCEGCEFVQMPMLAKMIGAGEITVGQILIEVHSMVHFDLAQLFTSMRRDAQMKITHKERNQWGCDGYRCVEYSLISPTFAKEVFAWTHC